MKELTTKITNGIIETIVTISEIEAFHDSDKTTLELFDEPDVYPTTSRKSTLKELNIISEAVEKARTKIINQQKDIAQKSSKPEWGPEIQFPEDNLRTDKDIENQKIVNAILENIEYLIDEKSFNPTCARVKNMLAGLMSKKPMPKLVGETLTSIIEDATGKNIKDL